jgi:recombination protein RecR
VSSELAEPVRKLVEELTRLPGIGRKSAQRLAFHVLKGSAEDAARLAETIVQVKEEIKLCSTCFSFADRDPCRICDDPGRDRGTICVVQEPGDLYAIERGKDYRGLYHVLMGALSPLKGVGPESLKVAELMARLEQKDESGEAVCEVIVATNPDVEGEATAAYLQRLIKPKGIRVTRIGFGLPVGSSLEYADEVTMSRAIEGRREI